MTIFILCQGQQKRLAKLGYPKHLVKVGGEPVLHRTLRLLDGIPEAPVVVGDDALIVGVATPVRQTKLVDPGFCVLDGMINTLAQPLERDRASRIVFLLGDVVWSKAALASFIIDQRPVVFAGTEHLDQSGGEIFGCSFAPDAHEKLLKLLAEAPCRFAAGSGGRLIRYPQMQGGHLRKLLWSFMSQSSPALLPSTPRRRWHPSLYLPIKDFTDDIDDAADVARLATLDVGDN